MTAHPVDYSVDAVEHIASLLANRIVAEGTTLVLETGAAQLLALRAALTASEKDAARMQYLEDEAVHVEVQQSALADTGDYSVCMVVIERHMDERNNRVLGTGSTWREAIDNAMGDGNG